MIMISIILLTTAISLVPVSVAAEDLSSLPHAIFEEIAGLIPTDKLIVLTPKAFPQVRAVISERHHALKRLLDPYSPDTELPDRIREFLYSTAEGRPLNILRAHLSPQHALGVYDRVIGSESVAVEVKRQLICDLMKEVESFADLVACVGPFGEQEPEAEIFWDHVSVIPLVMMAKFPNQNQRFNAVPESGPIPDLIVDYIAEITSDLPGRYMGYSQSVIDRVSSRYPYPFNQIFPFNDFVADRLCQRLQSSRNLDLVQSSVVALALLRYGIQFHFRMLQGIADRDQIYSIYPLLQSRNRCFGFLDYSRGPRDHDLSILQMPAFIADVKSRPSMFIHVLLQIVNAGLDDVFRLVMKQPFFADLADRHGGTLLSGAFVHHNINIIKVLLSRPDIKLPGHGGFRSLHCFLGQSAYSIERLLRLTNTCPKMVELIEMDIPSVANLLVTSAINRDRDDLLVFVLGKVPSVALDIINQEVNNKTLLQYASEQSAIKCAAVLSNWQH